MYSSVGGLETFAHAEVLDTVSTHKDPDGESDLRALTGEKTVWDAFRSSGAFPLPLFFGDRPETGAASNWRSWLSDLQRPVTLYLPTIMRAGAKEEKASRGKGFGHADKRLAHNNVVAANTGNGWVYGGLFGPFCSETIDYMHTPAHGWRWTSSMLLQHMAFAHIPLLAGATTANDPTTFSSSSWAPGGGGGNGPPNRTFHIRLADHTWVRWDVVANRLRRPGTAWADRALVDSDAPEWQEVDREECSNGALVWLDRAM